MNSRATVTFDISQLEDTTKFAERLATRVSPGTCILLEGDLGSGKTHFARALIHSKLDELGLWEDVPSPTFTLVQTYVAGDLEIWHADLYRLQSVDELEELGLEDAFESAVTLIEWPDRLGPLVPDDALHLRFELSDDTRRLVCTGPQHLLDLLAGSTK
ncbi:MAG: tRNA (adenosine(37)-N6)-threonylcarbamoyltransferase complex ATPase subunit type 1 TsaE [Boseongicola sp.]|nr:tRNA (adenosine(37)-N6)-threonylcarbamoyltransferase complex ATPase subunit type 1 TsaE [Boseongicola sp.]MDD9979372.1 tRNA (adenosine(37)-N6)-threonylcarbamoyltransferase complex ATPase subunit type 1 TsaE [Boseongicola sp.]